MFINLVKARRTIRGPLLQKRISKKDLRFILEAARWAPSGHNTQPWEFIVVEDEGLKEKISESTRRVYEELLGDEEKLKTTFGNYGRWLHREHGRKDGIYVQKPTTYSERKSNTFNLEGLKIRAGDYCRLVSDAPALLITLLDRERSPPNMSRGLISLISVGAALQNIRLAARTMGVGCQDLARPIDTVEGEKRLKQI
ncbi:MAG: nitroreductase family protein, partial [Candidatus Bathyarchaeia archaeon]